MLKVEATPHFGGVFVSGDFDDIDKLYDAVWEVAAPIAGDDGYSDPLHFAAVNVLGLCYDLRHCYMGDREVMLHENGIVPGMRLEGKAIPTRNVRYGVNILWTEALFDCAMLRVLCERRQRELTKGRRRSDGVSAQARYDVSANHVVLYQSLVYDALAQAVSPNLHSRIMRLVTEADSIFRSYFTQYLEQFDAEFARSDERKRRKLLGPTMKRILEGGEDYDEFCRDIRAFAAENDCPIAHVSVDDGGWPDEIDW